MYPTPRGPYTAKCTLPNGTINAYTQPLRHYKLSSHVTENVASDCKVTTMHDH